MYSIHELNMTIKLLFYNVTDPKKRRLKLKSVDTIEKSG